MRYKQQSSTGGAGATVNLYHLLLRSVYFHLWDLSPDQHGSFGNPRIRSCTSGRINIVLNDVGTEGGGIARVAPSPLQSRAVLCKYNVALFSNKITNFSKHFSGKKKKLAPPPPFLSSHITVPDILSE